MKELTLENVQVDCRELTEEQVKEMANVFENNGFIIGNLAIFGKYYFLSHLRYRCCTTNIYDEKKTTITYEKFMELFAPKYDVTMIAEKPKEFQDLVESLNEELTDHTEHNLEMVAYKEKANKLNYELDFNFITQLAERMNANKGKYEPYNWQRLDNIEDLKQALFRHVMEVMKGNYEDDNRLYGHLEAIALNCMFINYQLNGK